MRRLQALSSSVSGGNPRGSGWGGGSGHAGSGAASDHSPGGQGGASKRGQQAAGRGQREEAQQEHASKRGSLLSPEGSGSGAGGNASQQQQEQQQQQQQQQQQRPKRLTIKDFLPAEGSSMPLFLLASDKDSGGTKHLIVGRKLGCGGQAVVLHVTEPVLDWEGFLVSGSLAGWKGVLPLEQQRRAGSAAAGSSSAAAAAGAGGSGQAAGVQYALKVALPWELTKDYERNPGPLAFQAYLLKADRGARREQRYLDQLHAPREGYVSRGSQHIIKCFQRGRVQLPGCGYPLPALLLEYCPGGSLWDKGKVDAATAACYIDQVMRGLQAIHQQGLSHSDLKGANCLLDAQGKVKLCDLGLLEEYTQGVCSDTLEGLTPAYRAPEMKVGHFHDQRVDVWMLGCLLLELRSGKLPFKYLEGRPDEEERRRREELDNPESDYYQLLGPEEEKMVKECLKVMEVRPTLSLLRDRCEMYFMLAQEAV
jgi:serine/threonine protein kinase